MKILIQKIDNKIVHDFSFQLLETIKYISWFRKTNITVKYINTSKYNTIEEDSIKFKNYHKSYLPVGSVEFVEAFLFHFYQMKPFPINVPIELFGYANRAIFNGNEKDFDGVCGITGEWFVKSNYKVKSFAEMIDFNTDVINIPKGNYQYSSKVEIDSEWRAFVCEGKLVGLQNYSGDFKLFPDINRIEEMISKYILAPVAYTLDVGINLRGTFVIECHNFYSCGLYGFNDPIYLSMLNKWYLEYLNKNK